MIHILLSQAGSYRDAVDHLLAAGARVTNVGPEHAGVFRIRSKLSLVMSMFSPALLRTIGLWRADARVLIIGWQALPVLALIRLGLLRRPQKVLVMGCFIHGQRARRLVNRAWRLLRFPGLGFIAFSQGEARNLVDEVGMPAEAVHFHLWRQQLDGRAGRDAIADDGYVFAGGFSNRDYALLLQATLPLAAPLVIVASAQNQLAAGIHPRVTIHRDLPEARFEALLARASVVAMPLKSQGEACGQSVLLRVLRNGKPLIATRHEAIEAYLGRDYPGFVPHDDVAAMREALQRAMLDEDYRAELAGHIVRAGATLEHGASPGEEIERILLA